MLRGINVSGQKKILMIDLKELYEKLGFKKVRTYIQSGNVIFETQSKLSQEQIAERIKSAIFNKYKFDVPVLVKSLNEVQNTLITNPFIKEENVIHDRIYVTFLTELPKNNELEKIKTLDCSPDKFIIINKEVFLYCPNKYGESKLSNNFFENKLKVSATTRNWKTVNKLVEIALKQ